MIGPFSLFNWKSSVAKGTGEVRQHIYSLAKKSKEEFHDAVGNSQEKKEKEK